MDSPTVPAGNSAPRASGTRERRALLFVIIIIALAVLGFLAYQRYVIKPAETAIMPSAHLTDAEKAQMLAQVAADSAPIAAAIPPAEKAQMLAQVAADSKKVAGSLTDAEKAQMLAAVAAASQQQ